jgi:hypothetical protein
MSSLTPNAHGCARLRFRWGQRPLEAESPLRLRRTYKAAIQGRQRRSRQSLSRLWACNNARCSFTKTSVKSAYRTGLGLDATLSSPPGRRGNDSVCHVDHKWRRACGDRHGIAARGGFKRHFAGWFVMMFSQCLYYWCASYVEKWPTHALL